jgi:hypothetical protein
MKILVPFSTVFLCFVIYGCQDEMILPEVVEISPADGEILAIGGEIKVVFNKPMQPETVTITVGGIAGEITSNDNHTEFVWTLKKWGRLPGSIQQVRISGRDLEGNLLINQKPTTVDVAHPDGPHRAITYLEPDVSEPLPVDTRNIFVEFDAPIDTAESSVSAASENGKPIPVEPLWRENSRSVEVVFQEPLEAQTTYTVVFHLITPAGYLRRLKFTFTTEN